MKRRLHATEFQIQAAVVEYMRLNALPGVLFLHVPNQQASGPKRGAFLKRMAVMPGAADIALFRKRPHTETNPSVPDGYIVHPATLWLELKSKGAKPTKAQLEFRDRVSAIGHGWTYCDSVDGALDILKRGGWCR